MPSITSHDGTTLAYSVTGTGPAVLFVDGAMCHRAFGPAGRVAEQLAAAGYRVYTYDRRGRGESGDSAVRPHEIVRKIEDIAALIQAAGGEACVIGVSSGGALSLHAAAAGIGVSKVAVYEAPYNTEEWQIPRGNQYTADLHKALDEGRNGDAVALFMGLVGMPPEAVDGMRQSPAWPLFEAIAPTLAYDNLVLGFAGDGRVPAGLVASITVPVLALEGGASPEFLRAPAAVIAAAARNGGHQTLPDQTHEVDATVIAPVLAKFFV